MKVRAEVFQEVSEAQRFLLRTELMIRRAQEAYLKLVSMLFKRGGRRRGEPQLPKPITGRVFLNACRDVGAATRTTSKAVTGTAQESCRQGIKLGAMYLEGMGCDCKHE